MGAGTGLYNLILEEEKKKKQLKIILYHYLKAHGMSGAHAI